MPYQTEAEMQREVARIKSDAKHHHCVCEFSKVLDASRAFCFEPTETNRKFLHAALMAYDAVKEAA